MKINPEKVLKHAEEKLQIDLEKGDQNWIELFKKFLKVEMHRLLMSHRFEADGIQIVKDRSYVTDVLITHIFTLATKEQEIQSGKSVFACTIVALGGYGRQEMNPYSDIDILFLLKHKADEALDRMIKRMLYLLWDIGLKVGHAVRTVGDAVEEGRKDFKSRTSMMEARFITGNLEQFNEFRKIFFEKCLAKDVSSYIQEKLDEITQRHKKHQGTVYLQEPHIKEGVGGLRDLSSGLWLFQAVAGYRSFEELAQHGILTEGDLKIVNQAKNFLLRVRNELHFLTGKCYDVLTLALQAKAAKNLGYEDSTVAKASESFMKDYYLHARNIDHITKILLARDEIQTQLKIRFPLKFVERHGFSFSESEIFPGKNINIFRDDPLKLFEVFLYCAHGNYQLSQPLVQLIRQHLYLVDRKIQTSPLVRDLFLSLMCYPGSMIGALRGMHESGLLGKYIPEFGRATCLVQHNFYHKYTLDEHTLKAIEYLDELKTSQDPRYEGLCGLLKEMKSPEIVMLATFFHDIGKIEGKEHSIKGAKITEDIFKRIQYDKEKSERVRFLVENHLLMVHLSQRRDLSEEKVIIDFSKKVQDTENLMALHLLTYADSRATGEEIWNEWKEALLWELYFKTKRYLEEKVILLPSEIQAMKDSYVEMLSKKNLEPSVIREHLEMLPINYLQSYRPQTIEEHLKIIAEIEKCDPKILWEYDAKTNTTELTVCTRDHVGLFSEITGIIASHEVNILSANIFTRKDGIVLDKFALENRHEKLILSERIRRLVEQELIDILQKKTSVKNLLAQKASQKTGPTPPVTTPIIKFENDTSPVMTIMEIQADDQIGFLYRVTRTFAKLGVNISLSKIATEKAQIYDVFYITDYAGKKIDHPGVQKVIKEEIEKAVESPLETID